MKKHYIIFCVYDISEEEDNVNAEALKKCKKIKNILNEKDI